MTNWMISTSSAIEKNDFIAKRPEFWAGGNAETAAAKATKNIVMLFA